MLEYLQTQDDFKEADLDLIQLFKKWFIIDHLQRILKNETTNLKKLIDAIRQDAAFIITGTGVSSAIVDSTDSNVVTWDGLLNAVKYEIEMHCGVNFEYSTATEPEETIDMYGKAKKIENFLKSKYPHIDYRKFIYKLLTNVKLDANSQLGSHQSLAMAIHSLNIPIATTIYDMLLDNCLKRF
jgi:hypothetical protein